MARPSGGFTEGLLVVAKRSFVAGCFGCLGVGTTGTALFLVLFVVFQTQFVALVKTIPIPLFTPPTGIEVAPTAHVTPTAELPAIEIWVSADEKCTTPHITQLQLPIQQPLFICARNPKGATAHFVVRITMPTGQVVPLEAELTTDPSGKPFSVGHWRDAPTVPGIYRIDAVIGTTIVGSAVLTVVT